MTTDPRRIVPLFAYPMTYREALEVLHSLQIDVHALQAWLDRWQTLPAAPEEVAS